MFCGRFAPHRCFVAGPGSAFFQCFRSPYLDSSRTRPSTKNGSFEGQFLPLLHSSLAMIGPSSATLRMTGSPCAAAILLCLLGDGRTGFGDLQERNVHLTRRTTFHLPSGRVSCCLVLSDACFCFLNDQKVTSLERWVLAPFPSVEDVILIFLACC